MRNRIYAWWMKAIALVLLFVSIVVTAASVFSAAVVESVSGTNPSVNREEFTDDACAQIFNHETYRMMQYYFDYGNELDFMEGYNLSYAVIASPAYNYEDVNLTDDSAYLYRSEDFTASNVDMQVLAGVVCTGKGEVVSSVEAYDYNYSVFWLQRLFGGTSLSYTYWQSDEDYTRTYGYLWVSNYSDENGPQVNVSFDGMFLEDEDSTPAESLSFYWVVGYLREGLPVSDTYRNVTELAGMIWGFYSCGAVLSIVGILIAAASVIYLCMAAGHHKGSGEITIGRFDRVPYIILLGGTALIECGMGLLVMWVLSWIVYYSYRSIWAVMGFILLTVLALAFYLAACLLVGSTVTRIKARSFWKNTLVYHVVRVIKKLWKILYGAVYAVGRHLPMAAVIAIAFVAATLVELVVIRHVWWYYSGRRVLLYALLKCAELALLIWAGLQMQRIKKGGERIAEGKLTEPISTENMVWEWKRHAQNINKAGDGIALAVEEQMKSERFRTELITNVSHDIKTPLTSIINYVDLIKKEDITDPTVLEYVDVLDRQSARLKKLIEDLMEASKASTGNIEVNLEICDVKVLAAQMLGEFEERAQANGLCFVIQTPEEDVKIMADGRHIWRALENLISNACKYSLPGTRVYVNVSVERADSIEFGGSQAENATASEGFAVISIKNISKDPLNISSDELLERFVRGDSSRNTEGSGLGLSIAQSLAERMNGTLTLTVDGDLFKATLRFPLCK
ncbi:MAG: HAMP domain-containing histidine kinase [Clostridiales bacterium]|nr:HAMP domain-containing histidine kinase [Clostridiales bacterium]